ncbi:OprD family outer membrane porin [Thermodesulfobacteriota bacterium]
MKQCFKVSLFVILILSIHTYLYAIETKKQTLKGNMTVVYSRMPSDADSLSDAFTNGIIYSRIRSNIFYYDWKLEDYMSGGKSKSHSAMGLGGSLIYKSAPLNGFSGTIGLYTSQNPWFFRKDKINVGYLKSGKDTLSRSKVNNGGRYDGSYGMTVLGQAYLRYDTSGIFLDIGRHMFESVFTASNDTKMVPNTFDGISAEIKPFSKTKIQFAYFAAQKLRDHTSSHDVIAFDSWNENDDSAVNKSLTKALVGTDNELLIATANIKEIKNFNATVSYLSVPHIISNTVLESHYKFSLGEWSVIPGMRLMLQRDHLDTTFPVANLKGKISGYHNPENLDGKLYAARLDIKKGPLSFRIGYSKVFDDADIIAPWRGFPTGGFTRAMAQYNWYANTESYLMRFDCDLDKARLISGFKMLARFVIQNFDDLKTGVQPDSNVIQLDIIKKLADNLEAKFRFGTADSDNNTYDINGSLKTDVSYSEYRLEFNYFF